MENKNKKGTVSEALSDIQLIKNALQENSKEILKHLAVQEIEGVVKKSLREDFDEEDIDDTESLPDDGAELPVDGDGDLDSDSGEVGMDIEADSEGGDVMGIGTEPESDEVVDDFSSDMDSEVDLTSASDNEVLAVYKQLSMSDEIEIVGDEVHLDIKEPGKYIVKPNAAKPAMGGGAPMGAAPMGMGEPIGLDSPEMGDEESMDIDLDEPMGEPEMDIAIDSEEGGEGFEDDDDTFGEGVVYEIEINENEGAHFEHMKETPAPNKGDIEGQKASVDTKTSGDNLVGGFKGKEAKNGSGDAHGKHIMSANGETDGKPVTKATAKPAEEKTEAGSGDAHGENVMEGEEEFIEESIPKGVADSRRVPGQANIGQPRGAGAVDITESTKYKELVAEAKKLKLQNEEFTKALSSYKKMLAETVVYNSNLTQTVKLFIENATTRDEKKAIILRFDNEVKSLKESKQMGIRIANELSARTPLNESVIRFDKTAASGSNAAMLNEQSVYVDKETSRIKELMERVSKLRG
jgi:hypothetical protein